MRRMFEARYPNGVDDVTGVSGQASNLLSAYRDSDRVTEPFSPGSVSLRLYPHNDLPAPDVVEELRRQARAGEAAGFDGVMVSEHHGGFAGYLPNPIQTAGFLLDATDSVWVAPAPVLLPLRPVALVAEELAWLRRAIPAGSASAWPRARSRSTSP